MRYREFFTHGTLLDLLLDGNPYKQAQTYALIRRAFNYEAHYVNYGYWPNGLDTHEPGRELALLMGRALELRPGEALVDCGAGLGQAAVDLALHHDLRSVDGLNVCAPQVRFANALAREAGLEGRVRHHLADAVAKVGTFADGSVENIMALECITHFPDHRAFIQNAFDALPSGGRLAFAVATANKSQSGWQRAILQFVMSVQQQPASYWSGLLRDAGFVLTLHEDITTDVVTPCAEYVRSGFADDPEFLDDLANWPERMAIEYLIRAGERGVENGTMGYELFVGRKP